MRVKQVRLVTGELDESQAMEAIAFFDKDGDPAELSAVPVAWEDVKDKPTISDVGAALMGAVDATAALTAVGAATASAVTALAERVAALEAAAEE